MEHTPHTPGPWEWIPYGRTHFVLKGPGYAEGSTAARALGITAECDITFRENAIDYDFPSDALLIAAAPELEDVLNTLPAKTVRVIDGREYITFDYAEFANWDAGKRLPALAKAKGE